ncbi:hypothetical protein SO802_013194 [Lithocarpus litseifolius]|uniref:Uncharacterized protein n=1 Tax=Lithocarpus litseifolius TaxID=425828 RepID=A0AAW2D7L3_9ROSI
MIRGNAASPEEAIALQITHLLLPVNFLTTAMMALPSNAACRMLTSIYIHIQRHENLLIELLRICQGPEYGIMCPASLGVAPFEGTHVQIQFVTPKFT